LARFLKPWARRRVFSMTPLNLLCLSSRTGARRGCRGGVEVSVDLAREVSLEASPDLAQGAALGGASIDVCAGAWVHAHAPDDGHLQGAVETAVAAAVDPVPGIAGVDTRGRGSIRRRCRILQPPNDRVARLWAFGSLECRGGEGPMILIRRRRVPLASVLQLWNNGHQRCANFAGIASPLFARGPHVPARGSRS